MTVTIEVIIIFWYGDDNKYRGTMLLVYYIMWNYLVAVCRLLIRTDCHDSMVLWSSGMEMIINTEELCYII